jgi:hypothetical protein
VTIIVTNSTGNSSYNGSVNLTGGSSVTFNAPKSDPAGLTGFAGVAIFQDPAMGNGLGNSLYGNSSIDINGTIYMPDNSLDFGGTSAGDNQQCTHLIANTIDFHGTPDLGNNCSTNGSKNIGIPSVTLVL